ncbi:Uncharacterised protein [Pragia fontium]|uniref:phage tail protein n=1 Tax=Pragia fontium TaxID=82985 RepID=UPI000DFC7E33|nr:phage tail protein [Pragia fontium]SUB82027.1 Uncharacterised protein [Pragia fontium]
MANIDLKEPVNIQSNRIDATLLPPTFSQPYQLYVIQSGTYLGLVAAKANQAGAGAYEAQKRNDEQDIILIDHDARITTNKQDIDIIKTDYISKSSTSNQSVQAGGGSFIVGDIPSPTLDKLQVEGSANVSISYKVAGLNVVGIRNIGWTASTGTALKGAFNADQSFSAGATYNQSEILSIAAGLIAARQRIKALEDMCRTHGLIN